MNLCRLLACLCVSMSLAGNRFQQGQDSLPPLREAHAPQNLDELWAGDDPRAGPLDVETLQEWEQEGVVCRVVRYRVGTFIGAPAMMEAFFGFPKGATHLPGLVQVHGGGQNATIDVIVANADFHGTIDGTERTVALMHYPAVAYSRPIHLGHRSLSEYTVTGLLWFDQYLKGDFKFPRTPQSTLAVRNGLATFTVAPDRLRTDGVVEVYYTQGADNEPNNRFWHYAPARRHGKAWVAALPLLGSDRPLRVFANVAYPLAKPVAGVGIYYEPYIAHTFSIASQMHTLSAAQLRADGARTTDAPSLSIESFGDTWRKEWFTFEEGRGWPYRTLKLSDAKWQAPAGARLALDIRTAQANRMVVQLDGYSAELHLNGGDAWQTVVLSPADFIGGSDGKPLPSRAGCHELALCPAADMHRGNETVHLGGDWQGAPAFRNLRWVVGP